MKDNKIKIIVSLPIEVEEKAYIQKIKSMFDVLKVSKEYKKGIYKKFYIYLK